MTAAIVMAGFAGGCSIGRTLAPATYTVQRGDTLSEIAQRYHVDWHDLARWNHIQPPYRIDVGRKLTLDPYPPLNYAPMSGHDRRVAPTAGARRPETATVGTTHPLAQRSAPTVKRQPAGSFSQSAQASKPSPHASRNRPSPQRSENEPAPATSAEEHSIESATSSTTTRQTTVKAGGPSEDGWQWPAGGPLLRAYDPSSRRRGIEIGGQAGAPVDAASSGTVVYNGTGLKGYGKLIIIKHDEHYLSAYGFNQKSLVEQGQTVAAGAHIADMGHGPGNKPMLHFEIRHDGDPIDPRKLLPSR